MARRVVYYDPSQEGSSAPAAGVQPDSFNQKEFMITATEHEVITEAGEHQPYLPLDELYAQMAERDAALYALIEALIDASQADFKAALISVIEVATTQEPRHYRLASLQSLLRQALIARHDLPLIENLAIFFSPIFSNASWLGGKIQKAHRTGPFPFIPPETVAVSPLADQLVATTTPIQDKNGRECIALFELSPLINVANAQLLSNLLRKMGITVASGSRFDKAQLKILKEKFPAQLRSIGVKTIFIPKNQAARFLSVAIARYGLAQDKDAGKSASTETSE